MDIRYLVPTHNSLRDNKSVRYWLEFIEEGRIFRGQDKPISIVRLRDRNHAEGKNEPLTIVHDGHHRLVAMIKRRAFKLLECEYEFKEMHFDDYQNVAPEHGWFTPFDPITECRVNDFANIKAYIQGKWDWYRQQAPDRVKAFYDLIDIHKSSWIEKRRMTNMEELAHSVSV